MNKIKLSIIILIFFISENNNNFVRSKVIRNTDSNSYNSSNSSNSSNSLISSLIKENTFINVCILVFMSALFCFSMYLLEKLRVDGIYGSICLIFEVIIFIIIIIFINIYDYIHNKNSYSISLFYT
jgi:hypothetical protein